MKCLHLSLALCAFGVSSGVMAQDATVTPGYVNSRVTQDNIATTICKSGWTKTVRPSVGYTNYLKKSQLASGVYKSDKPLASFEEDHRVPLEVGGHPTDTRNLWPQPWLTSIGAHSKDVIENTVHRRVCSGKMTLAEGQAVFLGNPFEWWNNQVK